MNNIDEIRKALLSDAKPPKEKFWLYRVAQNYFRKIFGYCPQHGWFMYPKRFRMNTAYLEEESNYSVGCKHCQKECFDYYEELWNDYYSSRF